MKYISQAEALQVLGKRQRDGQHVDSRLLGEVKREGRLFLVRLEDEEAFLSLIWQESDPARLLTPYCQPRILRDVAQRLINGGYTFESLARDLGLSPNKHQPMWFERCVEIDKAFDFEQFGWVAVVAATDGEREQSPGGTFYLFDGIHKSLVLATAISELWKSESGNPGRECVAERVFRVHAEGVYFGE
jgi:hypothetical protein